MANMSSEFLRTKVVPEVDAVRYATYSSLENITDVAPDGIEYKTGEEVLTALQNVMTQLDNDEVPEEGRYLELILHYFQWLNLYQEQLIMTF